MLGLSHNLNDVFFSENIPTPAYQIAKVNFHLNVHRNLTQLDYRDAKRIQAYTWQSLLRNHNVFMVHGPQTGKTLAYLPVMCTFILEKEERYRNLSKTGGPIVVILCRNSKKCEDIYFLTNKLLSNSKSKVLLVTYPNASAPLVS